MKTRELLTSYIQNKKNTTTGSNVTITSSKVSAAKYLRQVRQARYRAGAEPDSVKVQKNAQNQARYNAKAKLKK